MSWIVVILCVVQHPMGEKSERRLRRMGRSTRHEMNNRNANTRTLNSAKANALPKQLLGPSENVSKCLYPWISFHLPPSPSPPPPPPNHLSGLNTPPSSPHITFDRLIHLIGDVTNVPFEMCTTDSNLGSWVVEVPTLLSSGPGTRRGAERGSISSVAA